MRLTKEELWDSEEELRAYVYDGDNYSKMLRGEIGINLIQTHTAMSLAVMDDWAAYVFRIAESVLGDKIGDESEEAAAFSEIKAFCAGRTHNIWGASADDLNPSAVFHYDIESWMRAPIFTSPSEFRVDEPIVLEFGFSPDKQVERAALIQRYGTTPTGIGRIIIQMGRNRIWREPLPVQGSVPQAVAATAARRWPT